MNIKVIATGSGGNAYLVQHNADMLLLDAGVDYDTLLKAAGWSLAALQGVLLTHLHQDHLKAAKQLSESFVDLYASIETFKAAKVDIEMPNVHIFKAGTSRAIGNWIVYAFPTYHDTEGSLGFYFTHKNSDEKILYATDTGYISVLPKGLTVLLVECNHMDGVLIQEREHLGERFARLNKYHMSLERVVSYLGKIDRSELHTIVLLHMSDSNIVEDRAIDEIKRMTGCNVYAADAGMDIVLDRVPF